MTSTFAAAIQSAPAGIKLRALVTRAAYNVGYFGDAAMMASVEADLEGFTAEVRAARKAA